MMNHIPINITEEQRANFKKLADYLATGETAMKFDMNHCCISKGALVAPYRHRCGTVGCALGHGPAAGVKPLKGEIWGEYATRCFAECFSVEWRWCFSAGWADVDNTPQGASARIYYMLENGVPNHCSEQMYGEVMLCYEVPA